MRDEMAYAYEPEFARAMQPMLAAMAAAPKFPPYDVAARLAAVDAMWAAAVGRMPEVTDVEETVYKIKSYDGVEIDLHGFVKSSSSSSAAAATAAAPAVVYCHGGGYFALSVPLYRRIIQTYVSRSGVRFFAAEYRMPPAHPFPTPVEDCHSALDWVSTNGAAIGVDPARIAIMGDSAGGGLAAAVAIMARDRGLSPPLSKQILVYAMLDDRNTSRFDDFAALATWSPDDNLTGWAAYLGRDKAGDPSADVSPYGAPARVKSVAGLPPLYLDVPDLDIFRDEDIEYVARHAREGIPTEMHLYPGLPHAFEVFAPTTYFARAAMADRVHAIQSI
jgi:acetyl esterase/lipase